MAETAEVVERAAEGLRAFVRLCAPGTCRMLSMGDDCPCQLCNVDRLTRALTDAVAAKEGQIARLTAERDKWLDAFNRSEQFQSGPTKRAEASEAQLTDAAERELLVEALKDIKLSDFAARCACLSILCPAPVTEDDIKWAAAIRARAQESKP